MCNVWLRIGFALTLLMTSFPYSMSLSDDIQRVVKMSRSEYEDSALPGIFTAVGGLLGFQAEVSFVLTEASSLRNGISTSKALQIRVGVEAIVAKICFDDGTCWAAKMYEDRPGFYNRAIDYGTSAATLVQRYCPEIPINTARGCGMHKLRYCFTDWIEGEILFDRKSVKTKSAKPQIVTIPQKTVTAMAEFLYNLSTCPIPEIESKPLFGPVLTGM
jgi:hypothetical protein